MAERTFTKQEISRIIKRASELETERMDENGASHNSHGLTLDELSIVGADAGIDPQLVRRAAEEVASTSPTPEKAAKTGLEGKEVFVERLLDDIPADQTIDHIITDLDHRFRDSNYESWNVHGKPKAKRNGKIIEWEHTDISGKNVTRVLMQPFGKRYRIRISKRNTWGDRFSDWMGFLPYFMGLGVILAGYALDAFIAGIVLAGILFIGSYLFLRQYNSQSAQKHIGKIESLADNIADQITASSEDKPIVAGDKEQESGGNEVEYEQQRVEKRNRAQSGRTR
ncbi:MAG: hypothetical protein WD491_08900 [Balneolales bacterium]